MSSSAATFPARFAELVYLLANQPDATAEQEAALDAAASAVTARYASLTTIQLNVDLLDVGQTMVGVHLHELVMRMSAHSAHQIDFLARTPRAEILGVARILAGEATPNDDGAAFDEKLVELAPTLVEVHLGRNGFVRTGSLTPPMVDRVDTTVRSVTPFHAMPAFGSAPSRETPTAPAPPVVNESARATPMRGTPAAYPSLDGASIGGALTPDSDRSRTPLQGGPVIRDESSRIIERAIKTKTLDLLSDHELIEQLRTGVTPHNAMRLLDELAVVAETREQEQRWEVVTRVFHTFVQGETGAENDAELKRAYTIGLRRIGKPTLIRGIAGLLPRRPEMRDDLHEVLLRLGADGAEALIDLLTTADSLT